MFVPRHALPYDERVRLGSDHDRPHGPSDPLISALPTKRIEDEVTTLAAEINAATCRWLELIAELDRREAYLDQGCHSTANWLAWRCSISERSAREHVRVARRLTELRRVRAGFARGQLSYSKVRAITRVAAEGDEEGLVRLARDATASQLDRLVRGYRRALGPDDAERIDERRYFSHSWTDDGLLRLSARLAPEEGALFLKALDLAREELRRSRPAEAGVQDAAGESEAGAAAGAAPDSADHHAPPRVSNADALVGMAEAVLAGDGEGPPRSGADARQVVVHIEAREGEARLEEGTALAPETARRVLCDASLVAVAEADGVPLSVSRKSRTVPGTMRRALRTRDTGCRFPGCEHRRFTDAHHVQHWSEGGETSQDNLVLLCRRHHRLVHEGGFRVERAGDDFVFTRPDGKVLERCPAVPRVRAGALVRRNERRRAVADAPGPNTCAPRFGGERLDYGMAVEGLLEARKERPARGP